MLLVVVMLVRVLVGVMMNIFKICMLPNSEQYWIHKAPNLHCIFNNAKCMEINKVVNFFIVKPM